MQEYYRRLPMTGRAENVRDLGGYAALEGKATKFGRFLRSDNPSLYSDEDVELLINYGVKTALDLRSDYERGIYCHSLGDIEGINMRHVPMFNVDEPALRESAHADSLGEIYVSMAKHAQPWIKEAMEVISKSEPCVIFNCSMGKDRTGIIAAIILAICGVSEADIISDYALTRILLEEEMIRGREEYGVFSDAPPEAMRMLLKHIDKSYGGVIPYLLQIGVSDEEIAAIRSMALD